ncbi:UDP-N-acetylglucosamine 2-epimerase (non-hydrolyzing) [Amycolatopsis sp. A133]|uniref:non-hydrolyzing UDP-N-acetylglucosamine 2-epimerase n=1 Tax=Amycolatopsis sp. A133 TaxID=3064472 RepID=UPI0027ED412F|nr:UDP-N-acetylglucosamine 2-epimerase (non-hydrolyzing) [Amycolatopsis sp. A133]MDQ7807329.1 UDP-N-acetylglucosamine 2-epimerase (non-hydrolyzing) [Amycolatopsis sp. A133]
MPTTTADFREAAGNSPAVRPAGTGGVTLVCGTRPELIKLAPLMRAFGDGCAVVYTGQHYDRSLYSRIRADLPPSDRFHELGVGAGRRGGQLGRTVSAVDEVLADRPGRVVVVQGDTTSALAGALAANAHDLPLVHVEAGLRSHDRAMPEEHNRVLIDHLADLCCAPTELNRANLLAENVPADRIAVTGNTVVEALQTALPSAEDRWAVLAARGLERDRFVLATIHRPENVDDPARLAVILRELGRLPLPVVFPLHPRTAKSIEAAGLRPLLDPLVELEPQAYPAFLALAAEAAVIVSDSGGIQEEASVLKRPVVVVRRSTERPEIDGTFGTRVLPGPAIGTEVARWLDDVVGHRERLRNLPSPYGDGSATARIVAALDVLLDHRTGVPTAG